MDGNQARVKTTRTADRQTDRHTDMKYGHRGGYSIQSAGAFLKKVPSDSAVITLPHAVLRMQRLHLLLFVWGIVDVPPQVSFKVSGLYFC